ncbi:MAG: hypothetical protein H5T69_11350 [Chloroflexi bacterium]|nr:hypothetical protein [Chloroflexota bacterium]
MSTITSVNLLVDGYLITGEVKTEERRLLDILNDDSSDYVSLDQARIYRLDAPDEPVVTLDTILVNKRSLNLAVVTAERPAPPRQRELLYVEKQINRAFITVPHCQVWGQVHLPYSPFPVTPESYLTRDADAFFPITQAEVRSDESSYRLERGAAQVVLVRKAAIGVFSLLLDSPERS